MPVDPARFRVLFPRWTGSLPDAALAPLLDLLRPRPFATGEHVARQGHHSSRAVFVLRGVLEIRGVAPTVSLTVGVLESGAVANSVALIEPGPAEFDLVGRTPGAALELSHGDFLALRRDHPNAARVVLGGFIYDLSSRLRVSELAVSPQGGNKARQATAWLSGASLPPDAISPLEA